jgi:hypothetical protein
MPSIPPWSPDFLMRVVADTRQALRFDDAGVRALVAADATERTGIMEAEEHALSLLGEHWARLGPPLAWAVMQVRREYGKHPARIDRVREELQAQGADSWIAHAVRAQLAFDIGFDAVAENGGSLDL